MTGGYNGKNWINLSEVQINGRQVGSEFPPYIIAEACINHGGDISVAKEMVYKARAAEVDAIKFQYHILDDEMLDAAPKSQNFSKSLKETLEETNLSLDDHLELKGLCKTVGLEYLCTPFSFASADILDKELAIPAFKVGSGECTNHALQRYIAKKNKPMIVSTGMTTLNDIDNTVNVLNECGADFSLTHCVSIYPCPYNRTNLGLIPVYIKRFGVPIGLSDHSKGIYTSLGAVALGASIIEKHFTLDKTLEGPDHSCSLEPHELGQLVEGCKAVWLAGGDEKVFCVEEQEIAAWAHESVVTCANIEEDEIFSTSNLMIKRPAPPKGGIDAKDYDKVLGLRASKVTKANQHLLWECVR